MSWYSIDLKQGLQNDRLMYDLNVLRGKICFEWGKMGEHVILNGISGCGVAMRMRLGVQVRQDMQ